ncbi:hypothetical protein INT47_013178 [Mucor saturninus]|uniref:alpha-1,2-Mannosidase n=1 Tax=Mucor saturninus TaxID=64648 RepID=A0A8H7QL77_9FUNG|nr:hypothetical protein INT47_013178 [Mucor saturninus]
MVESFFEQRPIFIKTRQQIRLENGGLPDAHVLTPKEKQHYIKDAFMFSWEGYRNYSWGYDENKPVTNQPRNTRNGWGATIVDGLDTLYIMGLKKEFKEAQDFVSRIDWNKVSADEPVQLFETVIRYVGGLLSAYDLSLEKVFVTKAVELVDKLMPAFDTPTGIPYQYINFTTGEPIRGASACLAEIGTIQIEFTRLSEITGNWKYHYAGQHVYDVFIKKHSMRAFGLFPHLINVNTGEPIGDHVTWGGMGDSFYEYLIKQLVVSRGHDPIKKEMVSQIITSLQDNLLVDAPFDRRSAFLAVLDGGKLNLQMDELACFAPGSLLLAARTFPEFGYIEKEATRLMAGCYSAWDLTLTGLAPEIFSWDTSRKYRTLEGKRPAVYPVHPSYILRPETIESLYYFYVYTKDPMYQDMAWDIFNSLYTYCKTKSGYTGIHRVDVTENTWDDREESFFFAETLKYLYLIFDDPQSPRFPFNEWVFNTEAHPLRITDIIPPAEKKSFFHFNYFSS